MKIIECTQGTDEWYAARMGIPTASEFQCLLAKGRDGGDSKTRKTYMYKLAGELITGKPMYSFSNDHMERGKEMEDEARQLYCMLHDTEVTQVGFLKLDTTAEDTCGASPDSLIGDSGLLEIKTKLAHLQIELLLAGRVPSEHVAQLQGELYVSGRQWVDLCCYWPGIEPFVTRVQRDDEYIGRIAAAIREFNRDLASVVQRVAPRLASALISAALTPSAGYREF